MRNLAKLAATLACAVQLTSYAEMADAAATAHAQYRYHYVSLDNAMLPDGFAFFDPAEVVDNGKVYRTLLRPDDPDRCFPSVAVWQDGRVRVLVDGGTAGAANNRGTVGGNAVRDCTRRLALFKKGRVELVPPLPDDLFSFILQLTDAGIAFISSFTSEGAPLFLYRRGHLTPLSLGLNLDAGGARAFPRVNNSGMIGGTYVQPGSDPFQSDTRAFRFYPSGSLTLLQPRPTEPISWGEGINNRGDVLGYSFVSGGREAIGVWRNRPGNPFQTYFIEGTEDFPTISNNLLWNERGLIVITGAYFASRDPDSYIVPRPGVRLNLSDITHNIPAGRVTVITDLNDRGELLGFNFDPDTDDPEEDFLLQRVGDDRYETPNVAAQLRRSPSRGVSWRLSHPELLAPRTGGKTASMTR
jgi:hypothetical protein